MQSGWITEQFTKMYRTNCTKNVATLKERRLMNLKAFSPYNNVNKISHLLSQ